MSLKRLKIPSQLSYPVRITKTHVSANQSVAKGDPIYTLEDADGRRGVMRAPIAGTISEGPVDAGAAFAESIPVIGIEIEPEQLSETSDDSRLENESNKVDEKTIGIEQALISILEQAETATFAKGRSLGAFRTSLEQALRSKGYGEGDSSKAAGLQLVETVWSSANSGDNDGSGAEENLDAKKIVPERSDENRPLGWLLILLAVIGFAYGQIQIKLAYLEGWNPLLEIIASVIAATIFFVAFGLILGKPGLVKDQQLAAMWFPISIIAAVIAFVPAQNVTQWTGIEAIGSSQFAGKTSGSGLGWDKLFGNDEETDPASTDAKVADAPSVNWDKVFNKPDDQTNQSAGGSGNIQLGESLYRAKCFSCHSLNPNRNGIGPHFYQLFGRAAGSAERFSYSSGLEEAGEKGLVWSTENMGEYLAAPKEFIQKWAWDRQRHAVTCRKVGNIERSKSPKGLNLVRVLDCKVAFSQQDMRDLAAYLKTQ